jgi:hypothetical protein
MKIICATLILFVFSLFSKAQDQNNSTTIADSNPFDLNYAKSRSDYLLSIDPNNPINMDTVKARSVINKVFLDNGITLKKNVQIVNKAGEFIADGYDENHKIGYIIISDIHSPTNYRLIGELEKFCKNKTINHSDITSLNREINIHIYKFPNAPFGEEMHKILESTTEIEFKKLSIDLLDKLHKSTISVDEITECYNLIDKKEQFIAIISAADYRFNWYWWLTNKRNLNSNTTNTSTSLMTLQNLDANPLDNQIDNAKSSAMRNLEMSVKKYIDWVSEKKKSN